jgi:3-hydroxyisobutyrate dehydrogenase-like beta-hydroxyacid dehydrogenase
VIGLGQIGSRLAHHLLKAHHEISVWNRSPEPVDALVAAGARRSLSAAEAFQSDVVISVLFDDAAVREVLLAPTVLAGASDNALHICMSTISPDLGTLLNTAAKLHGFRYLSAPFFGRPDAAAAANLNILVAGDTKALSTAIPILSLFGKIWPIGGQPHHANLAKIAGNYMICCAVEAMSEAAALLTSVGADKAAFLEMMANSLFSAPIYRRYGPSVAGTSTLPNIGIAIAEKDVGLMNAAAKQTGVAAPFSAVLASQFAKVHEIGAHQKDISVALPLALKL